MTDARQPSRHRHHIRAVLVRLFGRPCLKQYVLWSLAVAAWAGILLGLWQCIPPLPKMTMHAGKALSLDAVSQDGTVLLATDDSYSSNDRSIHVWDVETGRQRLAIVGNWATVREVKLSPDGTVFTVLDQDDRWTLWETATGKEVPGLLEIQKDAFWVHSEKKVMSVDNRFSPDGRFLILQFHLLSNVFHYMLVFWDVETKAVRARLDGDYSELTIAKDGNQMAVCRPTKPGQFRIERWRLDADFPHAGPFQVHDVVADAIAISPTFDTFACDRASHDPEKADEIRLWDLATGRDKAKVMCFNLDQRNPRLQFSPNGQFLTADIPYCGPTTHRFV
jgi:WD40 repeat protein